MIYRKEQFYEESNRTRRKMKVKANNIIFLDIDGVLQPTRNERRFSHNLDQTVAYLSEKYHDDIYDTYDRYDVGAVYYDWDYGAIGLLRSLIEETRSVIVIHSSWGHSKDLKKLKALFRIYDLDQFIVDVVRSPVYDKEAAIKEYLKLHQDIDHYIVIDDDFYLLKAFGEHCCYTNELFTTKDYLYCKRMLTTSYRIEQKTLDDITKISLFPSYSQDHSLVDVKFKLLELKGEKTELVCLFNMQISYQDKLEYIIMLNHMIQYCNEHNSDILVSYTDFKDLQIRLPYHFRMSISNGKNQRYNKVDISKIALKYTGSDFLQQNEALVVKELDLLK